MMTGKDHATVLRELAQQLARSAKTFVEENGGTVVSGDTDTTFFRLGNYTLRLTTIMSEPVKDPFDVKMDGLGLRRDEKAMQKCPKCGQVTVKYVNHSSLCGIDEEWACTAPSPCGFKYPEEYHRP